ncbi:COG3014 family protein [Fodinibius sp. SL11]|uniref:COG3014 family protein n=1 Tax=Fodinibius sp. SL11 TaxID=3425690 RepID=UPI003F883355
MKKYNRLFYGFVLLAIVLIAGCATYYQTTLDFQENFVKGEIEEANKVLDKNKKAATKDKSKLLYNLQKGVVLQMLGRFEESNKFLEEAYIFTQDYRQSNLNKAASLVTNPTTKPYTGEDHELVLIHYYKALNYLRMNQYEEALVECRRINNRLNQLNDRYENRKNRYKRDAFAMNLMGIIYEASGDVNNAFIAYRNAYEAYSEDYKQHFNTDVPTQLKKDLLRTAYLNGFPEELERYEKKFSTEYKYQEKKGGELVFFWHNGLGPVKDEWSLNFFIVKGQGGFVIFVNEELGLSFPFPLPAMGEGTGGLGDLKFIRVAFPKYVERKPYNQSAELVSGNTTYRLEMAQNINQIAFSTLEDRMVREFSNSLLRLALKQTAEGQTRKLNQNLGALLSIVNAVSEKADTRNWQTIPYTISYARVPLEEGENKIKLNTRTPRKSGNKEKVFEFRAQKGETIFYSFHSLESIPVSLN